MARILLAFADIGLALPLQEALEKAGHAVTWDATRANGPGDVPLPTDLVILVPDDASDLAHVIAQYRALADVPAVVMMGPGPEDQHRAQELRVAFLSSVASPKDMVASVATAISNRFAGAMSPQMALGALRIEAFGSAEDQIVNIVRSYQQADVSLVREALRFHVSDYVSMTDRIAFLRERRVLQVPEIEFLKHCDGSMSVQALVRCGALDPSASAQLLWALASVDAVRMTPEPPDMSTDRRGAVIMLRRHILARQARLEGSTFYDVLEVTPAAEIEHVERAVELLGMRYSPKVIGRFDLATVNPLIETTWQLIEKARQTLNEWSTRGRYNDWLKAKGSELNTTWARGPFDAVRAEQHFQNGQRALVEGEVFKALSEFASAARTHPDHPDYETSLAWARFRAEITRGKDRAETARKERIFAERAVIGRRPWARAMVPTAMLCAADGDTHAAGWYVREALRINPNLPAAKSLLARFSKPSS